MVIVFVLIWAIIISSPTVSVAQTTDLYPLSLGNKWTYSVTGNGPPWEMKADVWSKQKVGTTDCLVLRYTIQGSVTTQYYFAWQQGNRLQILKSILEHDSLDYSPDPLVYLVTPLRVGQTWSWDGKIVSQKHGSEWTFLRDGRFSARVIEKSSIVVPAGTFETYHIGIDGEIAGVAFTAHRWFAQGVGLVREDYADTSVTYKSELKSYFVSGFPLQTTFDVEGVGTEDWSASRSVTVDGTSYSEIDLPKSLQFDYKSSHTISVMSIVPAMTQGTRYVFVDWNDGSKDPSRTVVAEEGRQYLAEYKIQYLLTVDSERGNPQGGGWHDSGASAAVSVDSTVPMQGIMGILGAKYVFAYWHDSKEPGFQSSGLRLSIVVDGPRTLRAVWREDYQSIYILVAAIVVLASVIVVLVASKKSSRAKAWFSQPLRAEKRQKAVTQIPAPPAQQAPTTAMRVEPETSEKPPAPPVGEGAVWTPIVFLGLMILLGWVFGWILGLVLLLAATLYVHYDAKKYQVESHAWLTLLFAIIGLPLHANELHKLRKAQQTGQVRTLIEAGAPTATIKPQPLVSDSVVADVVKPTKFCRECGAKIPRDSRYCEKCGAELGEDVSRETPREFTSGALPKKRGVRPGTIGLFMVFLVVIWAVSPVFVADPTPALVLTNTGVKGNFTLRLQNLTPWPITFRGWWIFTYPIQWMGTNGPAEVFTLPPFGAYIFEYYTIGGSETNSPVTFSGRVTLLYRSYPVWINSW
jgi:predicted nucleic acid-binding Zn ribbon protein